MPKDMTPDKLEKMLEEMMVGCIVFFKRVLPLFVSSSLTFSLLHNRSK